MTSRPDVGHLLALVQEVAWAAGALAQNNRESAGVAVTSTKSSPTDVVTVADTAVEAQIREAVARERPHDGVLGEEGVEEPGSSGLRWVVDPIDGTVNYLYGQSRFAVSIAVEDERGALVAAVHAPVSGETWSAVRGGGAWLNGQTILTTDCSALASALVGTGFGYRAARRTRQAEVLAHVLPEVRDVRRAAAASLDLCDVACGRLDGFYEQGLQPWDVAAGRLVVAEAGGHVTGLRGLPPSDQMVVAAGPGLHPLLLALLEGVDADRAS